MRLFFYTTLVAALGATLYFGFFSSLEKVHPQKCYDQFVAGNYLLAEESLKKAHEEYLFPLALYQGLLAQAKMHFMESEYFLQQVLRAPPAKHQKEVLIETYLAQMTNAFMQNQDHLLSPLLDMAKQFSPCGCVTHFFEGLKNYVERRYAEALGFWTTLPCCDPSPSERSWAMQLWEKFFPLPFRHLHIAHCLTEEGNIAAGREILEREQHNLDDQNSEYYHLATLFLGLTYVKEAAEYPPAKRESFYQLAHFYFSQAEKIKPFHREKEQIAFTLQEEIYKLLADMKDAKSLSLGFAFIRLLYDWKLEERLKEISHFAIHTLAKSTPEEAKLFCTLARKEFVGTLFYDMLTQGVKDALVMHLREGNIEPFLPLWHISEELFVRPQMLAKEIISLTKEELLLAVQRDDEMLGKTIKYLRLWNFFPHEKADYERLSLELFELSKNYWSQELGEGRGAKLFLLSLQLAPDKVAMEHAIQNYLTLLYKEAENANLISRMSFLHDALLSFGLGAEKDLIDRCKLANHLADAEYLYQARNYTSAKNHAEWVLKHEPTNQKALRLVGLASFQLGQYKAALEVLENLPIVDLAIQKAIVFSQAFSQQEELKTLAQIDTLAQFDEEEE